NKVSAILHAGYPVRSWDHDIGPAQTHLFHADGGTRRDLTAGPADALRDSHFDVSRDGAFVVTSWNAAAPGAALRSVLVRIDVATGE
ncbi:S9 family peptidase, partial [Enterococcus faecium]